MAAGKLTLTLDSETASLVQESAQLLAIPKAQVIRNAVRDFRNRIDRVTDEERLRRLRVFDEMMAKIPRRSARAVQRELREIRAARRTGGRRTRVE